MLWKKKAESEEEDIDDCNGVKTKSICTRAHPHVNRIDKDAEEQQEKWFICFYIWKYSCIHGATRIIKRMEHNLEHREMLSKYQKRSYKPFHWHALATDIITISYVYKSSFVIISDTESLKTSTIDLDQEQDMDEEEDPITPPT